MSIPIPVPDKPGRDKVKDPKKEKQQVEDTDQKSNQVAQET
jgi:hypothetical protein